MAENNNYCDKCNKTFINKAALIAHNKSKAHLNKIGGLNEFNSKISSKCGNRFMNIGFEAHKLACGGQLKTKTLEQIELYNKVMNNPKNFDDVFRMKVIGEKHNAPYTIEQYIYDYENEIKQSIRETIKELGFVKVTFKVELAYSRLDGDSYPLDSSVSTPYITLFSAVNIDQVIEDVIEKLNKKFEIVENELGESNLVLDSIINIEIDYWQINPFKIKSWIKLPFASRFLINVKNKDDKCFMWSILAALYPAQGNPHRLSNYLPWERELKFEDIKLPIQFKDVPKFEHINNLRINIYMLELHSLIPIYISNSKLEKVISLLIIFDETQENYHYVLIKNFQSFAKEQLTKSNSVGKHICERCFYVTNSPRMKELHDRLCSLNKPARIEMPKVTNLKDNTKLTFENYSKLLKPLATIYSDFEAINNKQNILHQYIKFLDKNKLLDEFECFNYVQNQYDEILDNNILDLNILHINMLDNNNILCNLTKIICFVQICGKSFTIKLTEQKASAYNIYLKSNYPDILVSKDYHYRGSSNKDTLIQFTKQVSIIEEEIFKLHMNNNFKEPKLSIEQEKEFKEASKCWMCNTTFKNDDEKVRDHDHFIQENNYRGAAHLKCNIQCHKPKHIPFFFHNMTGYDIHLFIKSLAKYKPKHMNVIGKTKEKYKAVDYGCIRFVDSLAFFGKSLDGVSKSLSNNDFKILMKEFLIPKLGKKQAQDPEIFSMCREKGIYCYDYVDSFDKYDEKEIPGIEKFNSILNNSSITQQEYERVKKMWKLFKCKNLGDYTDLYLKLDVFILADCFEKFITVFPLNPCNYISAPSLSWDVLMYTSKETIDLITDLDMFYMLKNNIRGGISSVMGNRRITAYNKKKDYQYLLDTTDDYIEIKDEEKFNDIIKAMNDPSHILYIDATALYSGIMTQPMPYKDFKFITDYNLDEILSTTKESETGYFIECDLDYPKEIHDKTVYFPFAPIKRCIKYEELSPWQQEKNINKKDSVEKLICDQHDKKNYLVHYRLLQFYLRHGMKLSKIHNIISFKQKCWMKDFVENNIHMRNIAKTLKDDFGIEIYKLLNNSVFGKTMENIDKYRDIRLLTSSEYDLEQYKKIISKPTFKDAHQYSKDLIAVEVGNYTKTYNKPIYLGFTILDLSKLQMYETYYDTLLPHFGDRISINAMDTDSMFLHIKSSDIYKEIEESIKLKKIINTSGALFSFKDEKPLYPIEDAIFIRSKQYSLKCRENKNEIKNKGIQKCVIKKMTYKNFIDCLENNIKSYNIVHSIKSDKNHNIHLHEQNKLSLLNYDDKIFILLNGIYTLPFGNHKIEYLNILKIINKIYNTTITDLDIYQAYTTWYY